LTYPSEKYEFVSWDDDIPNIWKVINNSMVPVPTNQKWINLYKIFKIEARRKMTIQGNMTELELWGVDDNRNLITESSNID